MNNLRTAQKSNCSTWRFLTERHNARSAATEKQPAHIVWWRLPCPPGGVCLRVHSALRSCSCCAAGPQRVLGGGRRGSRANLQVLERATQLAAGAAVPALLPRHLGGRARWAGWPRAVPWCCRRRPGLMGRGPCRGVGPWVPSRLRCRWPPAHPWGPWRAEHPWLLRRLRELAGPRLHLRAKLWRSSISWGAGGARRASLRPRKPWPPLRGSIRARTTGRSCRPPCVGITSCRRGTHRIRP